MIEFPLLKPTRNSSTIKKICIATPDIVGPIRNGGIGTAYTSLGESLAKAGHKVTFLYLLGNYCENKTIEYWKNYYSKKKINFMALPDYKNLNLEGFEESKISYRAYLWLKNKGYEIIHFPEWQGLSYYSLCGKKAGLAFQNSTIVIGTHSPTLWHKEGNFEFINSTDEIARDFLERKSVEMADVVISPSNYLLNWMIDNGWNLPQKTYVHQNILPESARKENISFQKKKINEVVFFGRLETRKGIELFCEAILNVSEKKKNSIKVTFLGKIGIINGLSGDQFLENKLRGKVNYSLKSNFNQFEAMEYLNKTDCLVVIPSLTENSPYTVLECLGANLPFIASNVGGIPELIDEKNREFTCFPTKSDEISNRILHCLENGAEISRPKKAFNETEETWLQWHSNQSNNIIEKDKFSCSNPRVSVCLVHYNRPNYLKYALESLKKQDYKNFEIVLVDDGSTNLDAVEYLSSIEEDFMKRGWKIVRQKNSYLGSARNNGVLNSNGEYIIFMDDDNYAKPNEISTYVQAILYSDSDLITCVLDKFKNNTEPSEENYVSRWVPLGPSIINGIFENCFGDANCIISRETFNKIGGFTEEYGVGHEDWEFFAKANLMGFKHLIIPESLYLYRIDSNSMIHTTKQYSNIIRNLRPYINSVPETLKSFVHLAFGLHAKNNLLLNNHNGNLDPKGIMWKCAEYFENANKLEIANNINLKLLRYAIDNNDKEVALKVLNYISAIEKKVFSESGNNNEKKKNEVIVSIIILSFNNALLLKKCLNSIVGNTRRLEYCEIIVLDNDSSDDSKEILLQYISRVPNLKVVFNSQNTGFAKGNNEATKLAKGKYLLFLNNDTEVMNEWMEQLLDIVENDLSVGAVGSKLLYDDSKIQHAGVIITYNKKLNDPLLPQHIYYKEKEDFPDANIAKEYQALTAACLLVRKNAFDAVDGFDERFWNGYEDVDLCFKIREMGWKLVYQPKSTVIHHESQSGPERFSKVKKNIKLLHSKWLGKIKPDVIIQTNGKIINAGNDQICNYFDGSFSKGKENTLNIVSIIFLTFNQLNYTKGFINSIFQFVNVPYELIIVDNASTDGTLEYLNSLTSSMTNVNVIMNKENEGFPIAVNQGIVAAKGKYLLIANNDIVLTKNSIERLIDIAESDFKIGIVGPISNEVSGLQKDNDAKYNTSEEMTFYANEVKIKNKGELLYFPRIAFLCTLIKKEIIEKIGGLDERFSPGNYEDDDFCLRAQLAGYRTVIAKDVFIHHYGSKSFKAEGADKYNNQLRKNREIFVNKWGVTPEELWLENKTINQHQIYYPINKNSFQQYFERAKINIADNEVYLAKESITKALENFRDENELVIQYEELLNIAGNVFLADNDFIMAKEFFEKELGINPQSSSACFGLGQIFFENEQYNAAKTMFEWAVKNNPKNITAFESLKRVNLMLGLKEYDNSLVNTIPTNILQEN